MIEYVITDWEGNEAFPQGFKTYEEACEFIEESGWGEDELHISERDTLFEGYRKPIIEHLGEIRRLLSKSSHPVGFPYHDTASGHHQWVMNGPKLDITLTILESETREIPWPGVNFLLRVETDDRVITEIIPYAYTSEFWADERKDGAVAERWAEFVSITDPDEIYLDILEFYNDKT